MKFATLLLCFISSSFAKMSGPLGTVEVINISNCPLENSNSESIKVVWDKDQKMISAAMDRSWDITEDTMFQAKVSKYENGVWLENIYATEGKVCNQMENHFPKAFAKFRSSLDPPLSDDCVLKAGSGSIKNLEITREDIDLETVLYGTLKLHVVFKNDNEPVSCVEINLTSDP